MSNASLPDSDLLRRFARHHDEAAFAELVRRHLDCVHSVALRRLNGDLHLARDATQIVFSDLARKADRLTHHRVLTGWLFTSTRFAAAKLVRTECRRRAREQEASTMPDSSTAPDANAAEWEQLQPMVDEALAELPAADRDAVLLRFFENHDYASIGARLDVSANTARMRVDRALDKLHGALARRGITSTAAALGATLGAHAVTAAPAGLATAVTATAVAAGATASTGTLVSFLAMTKAPLSATAAILVGGSLAFVAQSNTIDALRQEIDRVQFSAATPSAVPPLVPAAATQSHESASAVDRTYAALESEAATLSVRLAALDAATAKALGRTPSPGKTYGVNELDTPPQATKQSPPVYPVELRRAGTTGEALIEFTVDSDGTVRDLTTLRATHEGFAEASLAAIARWEFTPGQRLQMPVNTRMQVPMIFSINPTPITPDEWF